MKSIVITIPLFLVGLAACSANRPANEPNESVQHSEGSSLDDIGDTNVERQRANVSPSSERDTVGDGVTPRERATNGATPGREIASPGQLAAQGQDGVGAGTTPTNDPPANRSPDNTAVNERERSGSTKTPLDQGNNQADLDITQAIRRAVVTHDSLSFNAKNVKIITEAGRVTLRGPVNSAQERSSIVSMAKQATGVVSVDDQLEVKP
jgi:hyperosmotically inducible periplasmic protein